MENVQFYQRPPTFRHFIERHLLANEPCLIGAEMTRGWRACREWTVALAESNVTPAAADSCQLNGIEDIPRQLPNIARLRELFTSTASNTSPDVIVPVADCNQRSGFHDMPKEDWEFGDFLTYWEARIDSAKDGTRDDIMSPANAISDTRLLYLKDWHFRLMFPDYQAYSTPELFRDDWMNNDDFILSDQNIADSAEGRTRPRQLPTDDHRFVYMGARGTWTALHADVFRSYSWSTNICGRKRWILFPPEQESLLRETTGRRHAFDYRVDVEDTERFPRINEARPLIVVQLPGETIFVPSDWPHQVHNLDDCISINHNWANAFCLSRILRFWKEEMEACKREMDDVRAGMVADGEWDEHIERVMRCHHGMGRREFIEMLLDARRRVVKDSDGIYMGTVFSFGDGETTLADYSLRAIDSALNELGGCEGDDP